MSMLTSCVPPRATVEDALPALTRGADLLDEAKDCYLSGNMAEARGLFRSAAYTLQRQSEIAEAWYWLGRCELASDRLEESRRALLRAIATLRKEVMPDEVGYEWRADLRALSEIGLADVAMLQGKAGESLSHLHNVEAEGLASRVDAGEFAYRKAVALEALGREGQAREHYLRAARLLRTGGLARESRVRADRVARARYVATAGVYSARSSAESVAWTLRERGVDAAVKPLERDDTFAVALGRYDTLEEAQRAARRATDCGVPASVEPERRTGRASDR
jgi:tetratricopeptide (TPR) repeat protein